MGSLLNSFKITKLDLENENPTGFINKLDTITKYSSRFITGTPTTTASPGPTKAFFQTYGPLNQYLELKADNLKSTTANSNLDVEDRTPNGGIPYKQDKDPTSPPNSLATSGIRLGNTGAFSKFNQTYAPSNTYLSVNPILGNGLLQSTIKDTNLDNTDPYKITSDPTKYPATVTGTPTTSASPGPTNKFNPVYNSNNTYLPTNGIRISKLQSTTANSNLDTTDGTPNGGIPYKQDKDPTIYPSIATGTPTTSANPGVPNKFNQTYTPSNTYLLINPIKGKKSGILKDSTANSNLDVTDKTPNGGIPYKILNDPTEYPATVTGTPTTSANPGPTNKFNQIYNPSNTYLPANGVKTSKLEPTTANSNLDVEDGTPAGGIPYKVDKDPTKYPALITGTPTTSANPGPTNKFNQIYTPANTYLSKNPIKGKNSGKLQTTTANTDLDVESPTPGGGIPYKQDKDPTIYSEYNTGTPTKFTNPGVPNKFDHVYNPKNRYLDKNPIKRPESGILKSTVVNTNLDVESPFPNGGIPYKQANDPTIYPVLAKASTSINGYFATSGKPAAKFDQVWTPEKTYLSSF